MTMQWTRGLTAFAVVAVLAGGVAMARGPDMNLQMFGAAPLSSNPNGGFAPSRGFFSPDAPDRAGALLRRSAGAQEAEAPERRRVRLRQAGVRAAMRWIVLPDRLGFRRRRGLRGAMSGRADGALHHVDRPHRRRRLLDRQALFGASRRQALSDQFRERLHLPPRPRQLARQGTAARSDSAQRRRRDDGRRLPCLSGRRLRTRRAPRISWRSLMRGSRKRIARR